MFRGNSLLIMRKFFFVECWLSSVLQALYLGVPRRIYLISRSLWSVLNCFNCFFLFLTISGPTSLYTPVCQLSDLTARPKLQTIPDCKLHDGRECICLVPQIEPDSCLILDACKVANFKSVRAHTHTPGFSFWNTKLMPAWGSSSPPPWHWQHTQSSLSLKSLRISLKYGPRARQIFPKLFL